MNARMRIAVVLGAALATVGQAQGVRVSGVTTVQSIDLSPLVNDSVAAVSVTGATDWRTLSSGVPVFCGLDQWCRYKRSGARETVVPVWQDVSLAAWGLGEGISVQAQVRARSQLGGGTITWPRANDHFDVLVAYVEVDKPLVRARLGRQWMATGLGAYDFDGLQLHRAFGGKGMAELFGGRSLLAGTDQSHIGGLLGAVDELPADDAAYLLGVRGKYLPTDRITLSGVYQRTIARNRSQLYSERAAFDASARFRTGSVDLNVVGSIATGTWEEVRLRAASPVSRPWSVMLEGRHHRPFFELWTIWGAFSPVGYDEARTVLTYRPRHATASIGVHGGYRRYDNTDAGLDLRTSGWRAGADATWQPRPDWTAGANYDIDVGFGGSRSDATASLRYLASSDFFVGVQASALQNIYEFRVGTGRVLGLALDGAYRLTPDVRLAADAGLYRHHGSHGNAVTDWSQRRVSVRLEWTLGRDPGARGGHTP